MPLILNIDTSIDTTYVCIAQDEKILQSYFSDDQKSNATNLHTAIHDLLISQNLTPKNLDAVAVTIGPGSYTGLRVGLATAKGLCYALKIPLINVGTLEMMVHHAISNGGFTKSLFCPMIDARRMEVFTAIYDDKMNEVLKPHAKIIEPQTFAEILLQNKIVFFGNGSKKWENINISPNAIFLETKHFHKSLNIISLNNYMESKFSDLGYIEPLYVKEFYNP